MIRVKFMIKKIQLFILLACTGFMQASGNEYDGEDYSKCEYGGKEYVRYIQKAKEGLKVADSAGTRYAGYNQQGYTPGEALIASIEDGHNDVDFYTKKFGDGIVKEEDPVTGQPIEEIAYKAGHTAIALKIDLTDTPVKNTK